MHFKPDKHLLKIKTMKRFNLYVAILFAICSTSIVQSQSLIVNDDIKLPKDSIESIALINSIQAFLTLAQENDPNNPLILESERDETFILIDEIQDIQKSKKFESDNFFKAHLTNLTPVKDDKYLVSIAYLGVHEKEAILQASFDLIAHKIGNNYFISSPLLRNTQNWNTKKIQNHIFHFPYTLDNERVQEFTNLTIFYDNKLENNDIESHYYLCPAEEDPLKLIGVNYKLDYNGLELRTTYKSPINKKTLLVLNDSALYGFDTHDLWHNRLSNVISRREINRRVDCNIAYLYGGSWGFSWEELFSIFSEKFVVGKNVDWLDHKS